MIADDEIRSGAMDDLDAPIECDDFARANAMRRDLDPGDPELVYFKPVVCDEG